MIPEDFVWSFSSLSAYEQCPLSWKLKYIDKEDGLGNGWSTVGSFVHELLEKVNLGEISPAEAFFSFNDDYPSVEFNISPTYGEKLKSGLFDFFSSLKKPSYEVLAVEREFFVNVEGESIRGFVDLELRSEKDGAMYMVDYKISSPFEGEKLAKKLRQMYLYSIGFKSVYGQYPDYLMFHFVKDQKWTRVKFDPSMIESVKGWALNTIRQIRRESEFNAKPDYFFCNNLCDYRHICTKK